MAPNLDDAKSIFEFVVKEGNGIKGLVDSGIAKVPEVYVHPPNERIDKQNAIKLQLPPIDLSKLDGHGPHLDEVTNQIIRAAETLGFFQVVNHGVPLHLLESIKDTAHKFFSLPLERKTVYLAPVSPTPLVKYGTSFRPDKEKALGWKDYLLMQYTDDNEALQYWPEEMKDVLLEYLRSSMNLVKKLLHVLLRNLGMEPDDSMIHVLTGNTMINMIFYPPCPNPDLTVGIGRHSDIGILTVLSQYETGGLYVKIEEDSDYGKEGQWIEIPPTPDVLVINVGDMLQVLSNGEYRSAEHVVRPSSTNSRVSVPIFAMPIETAKIAPLPQVVEKDGIALYREVVFGDYMNNIFENALAGKKPLEFAKINSTHTGS
ncbi:2-oxoglutarate and Fe(II)-dependent oxygenase superfamily protein [Hibiscus syriacus]|uniref:2-oxoglutarate and Fe(II)-dependent oxygenase superfamily protein n=1 Tax=Hibiscus syriacus TaxID=106335 RepID=A0A6A3AHQ3_HIBSY|nr:scopoletin 8-hydroxylase-like [Hibiscus syriacus]KAE8702312.1 2-oxoglutarate and Fe(II)-dependent oxygenase superfamily protein [Hibiscus syriacus]